MNVKPDGETKGESVEVVFTRRFAGGFTLNGNFTGLVERDRDFFYREFDPTPSWELSNNGTPWRFTVTSIWELPFGKTRWLARSGAWNLMFGGWQVAAAYENQPGPLLNWGNIFTTAIRTTFVQELPKQRITGSTPWVRIDPRCSRPVSKHECFDSHRSCRAND
jgi:hypothetical protein